MSDTVFIDTEVMRRANFSCSAPAFRTLQILAERGAVSLVTTDITLREIKTQIAELAHEAAKGLAKTAAKHVILRGTCAGIYDVLFRQLDERAICEEKLSQLQTFWSDTATEILPATKQSAEQVFEHYFTGSPPFSEPKKRDEFPDAFVSQALEQYAAANQTEVTVVSGDSDWSRIASSSKRIKYVATLDNLVDQLLETAEPAAALAHEALGRVGAALEDELTEALESAWFAIQDQDGEVLSATARKAEIGDLTVVATDATGVTVNGECSVTLELLVTFIDPSSGWYDHEDDVMYNQNNIEVGLERELVVPFSLRLLVNRENLAGSQVLNLTVNDDKPLSIWVDEGAEFNWK